MPRATTDLTTRSSSPWPRWATQSFVPSSAAASNEAHSNAEEEQEQSSSETSLPATSATRRARTA